MLGEIAEQAHELAGLLGDHYDLAVLIEDLASRGLSGDHDAVRGAVESRQQELLRCAFDVGARLYAEKPKAFGGRLES